MKTTCRRVDLEHTHRDRLGEAFQQEPLSPQSLPSGLGLVVCLVVEPALTAHAVAIGPLPSGVEAPGHRPRSGVQKVTKSPRRWGGRSWSGGVAIKFRSGVSEIGL